MITTKCACGAFLAPEDSYRDAIVGGGHFEGGETHAYRECSWFKDRILLARVLWKVSGWFGNLALKLPLRKNPKIRKVTRP